MVDNPRVQAYPLLRGEWAGWSSNKKIPLYCLPTYSSKTNRLGIDFCAVLDGVIDLTILITNFRQNA